jgi:trigger factor
MEMQITETHNEGLRRDYNVVIPASQIEPKINSELEALGQSTKIPGFRPGKIPMTVLRQRFLGNVLPRVIEQALQDSSNELMNERGLRAAGQPKFESINRSDSGDLEYSISIDLFPEIEIVDFSGVELERVAVEIPDSDVEEELQRIASRQRKSEPLAEARPCKSDDVVVIDFVGKIDGEIFEGGSATDHHLALGSGNFIPGFEDQLIGKSAGEETVVNVTFPDDYPNKEFAGKAASFDVKIKEIRELKPVEVNEEFAKTMGQDSLEALRKAIRDYMAREFQQLTRGRMKRQLLDVLAERHKFELPLGLVDTEFNAIWQQIEADRKAGRLDPEDKDKSDDALRAEYREIAERRVKLGLVLSEVGRKNNIEVSQEDLTRAMMAEARQYPGREQEVVEYYRKQPQALARLHAPIYEDKVVDFIVEAAKLNERKVTPKQLSEEFASEQKDDSAKDDN